MAHQQAISARLLKRKVGRHLKVIVDEGGPRGATRPHDGRRA